MPEEHCVGAEQWHDGPTPFVIVSPNAVHQSFALVHAVPLTTTSRDDGNFRNHRIRVHPPSFTYYEAHTDQPLFKEESVLALTEQARALAHVRLIGDPVARLDMVGLGAVEAGLRYVYGIPAAPVVEANAKESFGVDELVTSARARTGPGR